MIYLIEVEKLLRKGVFKKPIAFLYSVIVTLRPYPYGLTVIIDNLMN